jgi:hypothetical protein
MIYLIFFYFKHKDYIFNKLMYLYLILGIYYFCGITYFVYNDYTQAKKNIKNEKPLIDQNDLFDKLLEDE